MRQQWAWWVVSAIGVASLGCRADDDGAEERVDMLDASSVSALLDAGLVGAARREGGLRDAARDPSEVAKLPSASEEACRVAQLPSPPDLCGEPDATEPSSFRHPAELTVEPTCARVSGIAADKDEDAYRFTTGLADPVAVELSYTSEGRADLALQIFDQGERNIARAETPRTGASERIRETLRSRAGGRYDVRVTGKNVGLCQPYNLRVDTQFCTDSFEDNDTEASATRLEWADDQTIELHASAHESEADFFDYVTPKADPVRISGSYTANTDDSILLRRIIGPVTGAPAIDELGARSGPTTTFSHWVRSASPGTGFRIQIAPTGMGCAQYDLKLEAAACSDAFEDNDSAGDATELTIGQELDGTAYFADDDFYDLRTLPNGGSCTVTYRVDDDRPQRLRVDVSSATQGGVASAVGSNNAAPDKTVQVRWPNPGASTLRISAEQDGVCQPYTLRCDDPAPPQ